MGRWAYFHSTTASYSIISETITYKFWFGCQDSEIPYANESVRYFIKEYDEQNNLDLTAEQDAFWQKNQDCYYEHPIEDLPQEIQDALYKISNQEYIATDNDAELADYWEVRNDNAESLGIDWKPDDKKNFQENIDEFNDYLWNHYQEKYPVENEEKEKEYADLSIQTLVCYFLQKHGSYECVYEC